MKNTFKTITVVAAAALAIAGYGAFSSRKSVSNSADASMMTQSPSMADSGPSMAPMMVTENPAMVQQGSVAMMAEPAMTQ